MRPGHLKGYPDFPLVNLPSLPRTGRSHKDPHCTAFLWSESKGKDWGHIPVAFTPTVLLKARWCQARELSRQVKAWVGLVQTKHHLCSCTHRRAPPSGPGDPAKKPLRPGLGWGSRSPRTHWPEQEVGQGSACYLSKQCISQEEGVRPWFWRGVRTGYMKPRARL